MEARINLLLGFGENCYEIASLCLCQRGYGQEREDTLSYTCLESVGDVLVYDVTERYWEGSLLTVSGKQSDSGTL